VDAFRAPIQEEEKEGLGTSFSCAGKCWLSQQVIRDLGLLAVVVVAVVAVVDCGCVVLAPLVRSYWVASILVLSIMRTGPIGVVYEGNSTIKQTSMTSSRRRTKLPTLAITRRDSHSGRLLCLCKRAEKEQIRSVNTYKVCQWFQSNAKYLLFLPLLDGHS
jgi:hypothetical protein